MMALKPFSGTEAFFHHLRVVQLMKKLLAHNPKPPLDKGQIWVSPYDECKCYCLLWRHTVWSRRYRRVGKKFCLPIKYDFPKILHCSYIPGKHQSKSHCCVPEIPPQVLIVDYMNPMQTCHNTCFMIHGHTILASTPRW